VITPLIAIILGAIAFGGGIYETLLVDRVWPDNLAIIQPKRGGLDRKLFWGPINTLYEIALLACAWKLWSDSYARSWIIVALLAHFVSRTWSFAYFIPKAVRFENLSALTDRSFIWPGNGPDLVAAGRFLRWFRLSRSARRSSILGDQSINCLCRRRRPTSADRRSSDIVRVASLALLLVCGAAYSESIPLVHEHGTLQVPVLVNGKISLNFTIDSGASDVSIPTNVFYTLISAGTVSPQDFLDKRIYKLADGSTQ
jgi:hypothetical protein